MAEESIEPLVPPEKNEFSFDSTKMDINSAENSPSPRNGDLSPVPKRRASIASCITIDKPESCSSNEKQDRAADTIKRRVPIYLRASTGSCHDICKYGGNHASKENTMEYLRKKNLRKPSPKEVNYMRKKETYEGKRTEHSLTKTSKFSLNEKSAEQESSSEMKRRSSLAKVSPLTKSCPPRLNAVSGNKTRFQNSTSTKKSSVSEIPEVVKREISLSSVKVEVQAKAGGSGENKESVKRSSSAKANLVKVKPSSASGNSHGDQTGRKLTSSMASADKALKTSSSSACLSASRLSIGTAASGKARKVGRIKSSLLSSSSSSLKYRKRSAESHSAVSVKTYHVVETEARKGTEKSDGEEPEKTLHVIKDEAEIKPLLSSPSSSPILSSFHLRSQSLSSHEEEKEENEENDEIQNSGSEGDEFVSENTVSIETTDMQPVKEDHTHTTSPSSLSHEDDAEKINYSESFADSEIENLQLLMENHDGTPLSSNDDDDDDVSEDEAYPSLSSESVSCSLSTSSLDKNDEEINGEPDEIGFSEKMAIVETDKVQSPKGSRKSTKKSKLVSSEDKNQPPLKLKFRRGRIIDPQPESTIPKRLRFRRSASVNKTGDLISDSKKPMDNGNFQPEKTLRKAESSISYSKRSVDVKSGTPNKSLRKSRLAVCEDKSQSPVNLIRREKTVDSQMANKSPMRLKFTSRVARPEDGKSDLRTKTIKRAGSKNDVVGFDLSSRKVILKHPEVQRKKDGQVLLNNVIEETASKLVESRKSKVKALVGAFETVSDFSRSAHLPTDPSLFAWSVDHHAEGLAKRKGQAPDFPKTKKLRNSVGLLNGYRPSHKGIGHTYVYMYGRFWINPKSVISEICDNKRKEVLEEKTEFISADPLNDSDFLVTYRGNTQLEFVEDSEWGVKLLRHLLARNSE
ncbi:plant calmodulin-binding protein-related [Striga asiatica]|uniref:Plant calmodulin-binding protein-related n=1 Tax=Striga asiatica TaxID=4170 RepID=A0A5A7PF36_STRAF|nr:plant calmodulin-binding protein-related [Striga asiatica]